MYPIFQCTPERAARSDPLGVASVRIEVRLHVIRASRPVYFLYPSFRAFKDRLKIACLPKGRFSDPHLGWHIVRMHTGAWRYANSRMTESFGSCRPLIHVPRAYAQETRTRDNSGIRRRWAIEEQSGFAADRREIGRWRAANSGPGLSPDVRAAQPASSFNGRHMVPHQKPSLLQFESGSRAAGDGIDRSNAFCNSRCA